MSNALRGAACVVTLLSVFETSAGIAQEVRLPDADRVRIAEAFRVGKALGSELVPGATEVPFAMLLVTPEREFLLAHPKPSDDFIEIGFDTTLATTVYSRARRHPNLHVQASYPAVGGVATIAPPPCRAGTANRSITAITAAALEDPRSFTSLSYV